MASTVTQQPRVSKNGREIEVIHVAWTSDGSGDATAALTKLHGWLVKMVTDPGDGPTDNYDITLIDEWGADALQGLGLNRDTTVSETIYPLVTGAATPILLCGDHTFTVAAAGATKSGVAVLYILESL